MVFGKSIKKNGAYLDVRDVHALERVGTPSTSDSFATYTVREYDQKNNVVTTRIDAVDLTSKRTQTLKREVGKSYFNPIVSPSGKPIIAYTNGKQIFTMNVGSRTETQLTSFPDGFTGISNMKWSPCGRFLTFSIKSWLECGNDVQCQATKNIEQSKATWREFNQLYLRHWDEWEVEGRYNRVFVLPITTTKKGDLVTVKTVGGLDAIYDVLPTSTLVATPVPPFGGAEQYSISPDGNAIAVTGEKLQHDTAWRTDWKIFYIPITWSGSTPKFGAIRGITEDNKARTQDPKFVDKNTLYYLSMDKPQSESDLLHLVKYDVSADSSTAIPIDNFDRSIGEYFIIGDIAYLSVGEDGAQSLYTFDLNAKSLNRVFDNAHFYGFSKTANNTIVLSGDSFNTPANIYRLTRGQNGVFNALSQITSYNKDAISRFTLSSVQKFYFESKDGTRVQAFMMKPANYEPGKKYPLVHLIHGGPEGAWSTGWSYRWNPQLWTASGFAVLMINPRGSTGFGKDFTEAVLKNWGGVPFEDLMSGVDYALDNFDFIDNDKVVAAGASYGGYMINWINGNTNRYKALVCHDGVFSTVDMWYQTDELFFSENEYGGVPWEARDLYEKWNPERFVQNWQTPTLVIEGYKDFRVPWSQALSAFQALQRRGIDSKFIIFPSENHWVLNSANSIKWYDEVLAWLHKYTQ